MTFVDPFALHFDFQTLQHIARAKSDLLILVADSMDALRNWSKYYMDNPNSSLDRFLGEPGWRDLLQAGKADAATLVRKRYRERLSELNYSEFREVRVRNGQDRDIYTLLFASRAAIAAKIWDGIAKKDEFGQTNFGFDG
jgi:three-Cys-motif partner protein